MMENEQARIVWNKEIFEKIVDGRIIPLGILIYDVPKDKIQAVRSVGISHDEFWILFHKFYTPNEFLAPQGSDTLAGNGKTGEQEG